MEVWVILLLIFVVIIIIAVAAVLLWLFLREPEPEKPPNPPPANPPVDVPSEDEEEEEEEEEEDDTPVRPDDPTYPEGPPKDGTVEEYEYNGRIITTYVAIDRALMLPGGIFLKTVKGISVSPSTSKEAGYGLEISLTPSFEWSIFGLRIWSKQYKNSVLQMVRFPDGVNYLLTRLFLASRTDNMLQNVYYDNKKIFYIGDSKESLLQGLATSTTLTWPGVEALTTKAANALEPIRSTAGIMIAGKAFTVRNLTMFSIYSITFDNYVTLNDKYQMIETNTKSNIWNAANGRIINSYGLVLELDEEDLKIAETFISVKLVPYVPGRLYQEAYVIGDLIFFTGTTSIKNGLVYILYRYTVNNRLGASSLLPKFIGPDAVYFNPEKMIVKK